MEGRVLCERTSVRIHMHYCYYDVPRTSLAQLRRLQLACVVVKCT